MTNPSTPQNAVVIERILDAPLNLVWQMWTEPEHFKAWYGPTGAQIPVAKLDVRVGGKRLVCMEMNTPKGPMKLWFTGEFLEVSVNKRLVYTDAMSDEFGNVKSPADMGMPEGHPETTEVIIDIEDLGNGRTKMVLTHMGVPANSRGAAGWTMAIDKMTTHIAGVTQR